MVTANDPKPGDGYCLNCRTLWNINRRGLCSPCYRDPAIRAKYPRLTSARRGVEDFNGTAPPPEPTAAAPGTPEKLAVLAARAVARRNLWSPADAALPDDDGFAVGRFFERIAGRGHADRDAA